MSESQAGRPAPDIRTYEELLEDPFLSPADLLQLKGDSILGHIATLMLHRGDKQVVSLLLDIDRHFVEWDGNGEYDLWLEVAPEQISHYTEELLEQLRVVCRELDDRLDYGIRWVSVRETLPMVGPDWRRHLRAQLGGKRPTNHARRVRSGPPIYVEDYLSFTNAGERAVYLALKKIQENDLPREDTIGIYPLAGGRVPGKTWEPDVLVTYKGRAGVLEIDGPHHNARRALDVSRDHLLRDAGVGFVDRVTVEALADPNELNSVLRRFLRRLGEVK